MEMKRTLSQACELGIAVATLSALALIGCGGGSSGGNQSGGGGGGSTCSATTLTGNNFTPIDGNFGTLTGTSTSGDITFTAQSLSFFNDPLAKIYSWGSVPSSSGQMVYSNDTVLTITTSPTSDALMALNLETFGASPTLLASWDGTAASGVSGVTVDTAVHTATFTNTSVPGAYGTATTPMVLNGTLCLP